ncbi:MAG: DUF3179 domain-containing protein [Actinobacteria bacterium]|nr:DUF3179 domain-containing protein [Actinomycetota bacterium]
METNSFPYRARRWNGRTRPLRGLRVVALAASLATSGCASGTEPDARKPAGDVVPQTFAGEGWRTDFSERTVPLTEFVSGGPSRDGIPPIDDPRFLPANLVDFVAPSEPVIELVVDGQARAYPIQILIWHEIVNDELGGRPVAVTFCPLCNAAIAFDRRVGGRTLDFGTTGKLRNSDLVMYDRQTESWWQQFGGKALVGHYAGRELEQLPARIVAWRDFERAHPKGQVLARPHGPPSSQSGFLRPYGENPYAGYDDVASSPLFATANAGDRRLSPKERVVFIERDEDAIAIPFSVLERKKHITVLAGGERLNVRYRAGVGSPLDKPEVRAGRKIGSVEVRRGGKLVAFDQPFWFAVAAFRPDVEVVR